MTGPRRIVYVSGTRADFGLMCSTLRRIDGDPRFELGIYATGMHLSAAFGMTVTEIEAAGLSIWRRVPTRVDTGARTEMAEGVAAALAGFAAGLAQDRPDLVLVLGDRGEMLAGALAALYLGAPVAHIHGGELSGSVDEPIRHAISKLAHLHLVSTPGARARLIRMGERPDSITTCGAPGLDDLLSSPREPRDALCAALGFDPARPVCLALFHPVVHDAEAAGAEAEAVLGAILDTGVQAVVLQPNADAGSQHIRAVLDAAGARSAIRIVTHLPRPRFVSWLAACDVMVGNSSSGVIEAASFGTPVVNVGDRQNGRERSGNTVDVPAERRAIREAVLCALAGGRMAPHNVYGDGGAGPRIVEVLANASLDPAVRHKINAY